MSEVEPEMVPFSDMGFEDAVLLSLDLVGSAKSVEQAERVLVRVLDSYRYRKFCERNEEVWMNIGLDQKALLEEKPRE